MAYSAITIDTSVFDRHGCRLESGLLKQLDQFHGMPAGLVLSEIVVREIAAHMKKAAADAVTQLDKALTKCEKDLNSDRESLDRARTLLRPDIEPRELTKDRLQRFVESNGGDIVKVEEHISIDDIVNRYFSSQAPFSESGNKKNEFPDAMALLSLEAWAMQKGYRILAVSTDHDWRNFSEQSDYIDCVDNLASALEYFQPDNSAHRFCELLEKRLFSEPDDPIVEEIVSEVARALAECMPTAEADSAFFYDPDIVEIETHSVDLREGHSLIPVQAQEDSLAVQASFSVIASARCNFQFFVRDSVDKDYIRMGSYDAYAGIEPEVDVLIHLSGDFSNEEDVSVAYIELLTEIESVDFGEVEPTWANEPDV